MGIEFIPKSAIRERIEHLSESLREMAAKKGKTVYEYFDEVESMAKWDSHAEAFFDDYISRDGLLTALEPKEYEEVSAEIRAAEPPPAPKPPEVPKRVLGVKIFTTPKNLWEDAQVKFTDSGLFVRIKGEKLSESDSEGWVHFTNCGYRTQRALVRQIFFNHKIEG